MGGGRGDGGGGGDEDQLTEQEKFVVQKLNDAGSNITEKEYATSKKLGKSIRELKVPDTREVRSLADVELRRLQSR